jgi:hypothetical protein
VSAPQNPPERVGMILAELAELIPSLATLSETSDADMALMYLRHLRKELTGEREEST